MIRLWDKDKLRNQYDDQAMTLRDMARYYKVSHEAIRLVLNRLAIATTRNRKQRKHKVFPHFNSLSDYLAGTKAKSKPSDNRTLRKRYLPSNLSCSECGSKEHPHIHHIIYPARTLKDIQILCSSCHYIKHRKGMTYLKQLDLYADAKTGLTHQTLALKYNISRPAVAKIIHKIRNGWRTYRG